VKYNFASSNTSRTPKFSAWQDPVAASKASAPEKIGKTDLRIDALMPNFVMQS
jgi:hypothetical protein